MKKILGYTFIFIFLLIIKLNVVSAADDCSKCSYTNCKTCGSYCGVIQDSSGHLVCKDSIGISKDMGSCTGYTNKIACEGNDYYACIWNETKYGNYCNVDKLMYVGCGDAKDIPYQIPTLISFAVNFLKILTPIILIVISMISLLKALASSNEDEIKKAQKSLVRKIIAAVLVFFVVTIVQFVIMIVADSEIQSDENGKVETDNLSDCLNCFLNNKCSETIYYKSVVSGTTVETPITQIGTYIPGETNNYEENITDKKEDAESSDSDTEGIGGSF